MRLESHREKDAFMHPSPTQRTAALPPLRRTCTALLAGCLIATGLTTGASTAFAEPEAETVTSAVSNESEGARDFTWVQAHAERQELQHSELGTVYLWAATVSTDSLSRSKNVLIYGQLQLPYDSSEIDFDEDVPEHYPHESNYVFYNGGIKSWLTPSADDPAPSRYSKRLFQVASLNDDGTIVVRNGGTVEITLMGETFPVNLAEEAATVSTAELEEAITEHWAEYQAAASRGMLFEEASQATYLTKDEEARALVERAGQAGSGVTNADVQAMREQLNSVYDALTPLSFEAKRAELREAAAQADALFARNGKDGQRLTSASFDALLRAYGEVTALIATPDLHTIKVAHEAPPVVTHGDFSEAGKRLAAAIAGAEFEAYEGEDGTTLARAVDWASMKLPSTGHGYTPDSRQALFEAIEHARGFNPVYDAGVEQEIAALKAAVEGLEEVPLDAASQVEVTVRYKYPMENSPSALIKEYFRSEGEPVTHTFRATAGAELRIPLTDEAVFKRFEGYRVAEVNFNSSTLETDAKILTLSNGAKVLALHVVEAAPVSTATEGSEAHEADSSEARVRARRAVSDAPETSGAPSGRSDLDVVYEAGADERTALPEISEDPFAPAESGEESTEETPEDGSGGNGTPEEDSGSGHPSDGGESSSESDGGASEGDSEGKPEGESGGKTDSKPEGESDGASDGKADGRGNGKTDVKDDGEADGTTAVTSDAKGTGKGGPATGAAGSAAAHGTPVLARTGAGLSMLLALGTGMVLSGLGLLRLRRHN